MTGNDTGWGTPEFAQGWASRTRRSEHPLPTITCALGPDSAGTLLTRFVRDAQNRLDAGIYEVSGYYAWAFATLAQRGKDVRLLLDHHAGANATTAHLLAAGPVQCRFLRSAHSLAHWKVLVADRDRLAVGTGNLIRRDAPRQINGLVPPVANAGPGTREWWAFIVGAPTLAGVARDDLTRAWARAIPPPRLWGLTAAGTVPSVCLPDVLEAPVSFELAARRLRMGGSGSASASLMEERLAAAGGRALLTMPYIHTAAPRVRNLLAQVVDARNRGVAVRVLLGMRPSAGDATALVGLGLDVRVMEGDRVTAGHAKGAVIDRSVVIGSANWSETGLGDNQEATLCVDDGRVADYYAATWQRDWDGSLPLSEVLRLG